MTKEKWRVSKTISISTIIMAVVLTVSGFTYFDTFDDTLAAHDFRLKSLENHRQDDNARLKSALDRIQKDLNYLRDKADQNAKH